MADYQAGWLPVLATLGRASMVWAILPPSRKQRENDCWRIPPVAHRVRAAGNRGDGPQGASSLIYYGDHLRADVVGAWGVGPWSRKNGRRELGDFAGLAGAPLLAFCMLISCCRSPGSRRWRGSSVNCYFVPAVAGGAENLGLLWPGDPGIAMSAVSLYFTASAKANLCRARGRRKGREPSALSSGSFLGLLRWRCWCWVARRSVAGTVAGLEIHLDFEGIRIKFSDEDAAPLISTGRSSRRLLMTVGCSRLYCCSQLC